MRTINGTLKEKKYSHDVTFLSVYGTKKIKVVTCGTVRNSGVEDENEKRIIGVNTEKLENNISRSRGTLTELALCNNWDYFVTLTFDKAKVDRYSLSSCYAGLKNLIHNLKYNYGQNVVYVFVPEQHADGAWHFHGFLRGATDMKLFQLEDKPPKYIRDKLLAGEKCYDWTSYSKNLGWTVCEPIRSAEGAARYVTKYITKELARSVNKLGDHLYYCSNGLSRSKRIKKGRLTDCTLSSVNAVCTGSYKGDYSTITWFDYDEQTLERLSALIL